MEIRVPRTIRSQRFRNLKLKIIILPYMQKVNGVNGKL